MTRFRKPVERSVAPGKIGENRDRWLVCNDTTIIFYRYEVEDGPDHAALAFQEPAARYRLSLTRLSAEELVAIRDFIDTSINEAILLSEQLDKEAEDAWNNGDGSFTRSYRGLPRLHTRPRPKSSYGEGVSLGPAEPVVVDEGAGHPPDDVAGVGSGDEEVLERSSPGSGPSHD